MEHQVHELKQIESGQAGDGRVNIDVSGISELTRTEWVTLTR